MSQSRLTIVPVTLRDARTWVETHHRHSKPPRGWRFGVAVEVEGQCCGVGIAGRPVSKALDDGRTIEILRNCTDGTPNACSAIYGALCRAAKGLGYLLAYTYTLVGEGGASLRAAGFVEDGIVPEREWSRPSRPRQEETLFGRRRPEGPRMRWKRVLGAAA